MQLEVFLCQWSWDRVVLGLSAAQLQTLRSFLQARMQDGTL